MLFIFHLYKFYRNRVHMLEKLHVLVLGTFFCSEYIIANGYEYNYLIINPTTNLNGCTST